MNVASLANIEALDSVEPEDIDAAWLKQNWWQAHVNMQLEVHFKLTAPERLRALQTLNAAHRATDITSIVSSEEGPVDLSSRSWTLLARMRTGLALDALDFRPRPGCGVMMDNRRPCVVLPQAGHLRAAQRNQKRAGGSLLGPKPAC